MGYYESFVTEFFLLILIPVAGIILLDGMGQALQFLTLRLPFSSEDTWLVRQAHKARLRRSQLGVMVSALGFEQKAYLQAVPIKNMCTQLNTCHACARKQQCNKALSGQQLSMDTVGFCPNKSWLAWFAATPGT